MSFTLAALLIAAGVLTVVFWHTILDWAQESLFPWIEKHYPSLADAVRVAFVYLDKAAVAVRRSAAEAWKKLRKVLIHQTLVIERSTSGKWTKRITLWLRNILGAGDERVTKVTEEQEIKWEDLPEEIRKNSLRGGKTRLEYNITGTRDEEFKTVLKERG